MIVASSNHEEHIALRVAKATTENIKFKTIYIFLFIISQGTFLLINLCNT